MVMPPLRFHCNVCGFGSADSSRFFEHMDRHPGEAQMPDPTPDGLLYAAALDLADAHAPLELVAKVLDKVKSGG